MYTCMSTRICTHKLNLDHALASPYQTRLTPPSARAAGRSSTSATRGSRVLGRGCRPSSLAIRRAGKPGTTGSHVASRAYYSKTAPSMLQARMDPDDLMVQLPLLWGVMFPLRVCSYTQASVCKAPLLAPSFGQRMF